MQHSYLIKTFISPQHETSIADVCRSVIDVIQNLVKIDPRFSEFYIGSYEHATSTFVVDLNSGTHQRNDIAESLAKTVIENEREEIAHHDNEHNPTLEFKRSIGFSCALVFTENGEENGLVLNLNLGGCLKRAKNIFNISSTVPNEGTTWTVDWYERIIKCVVEHFDAEYSSLIFRELMFYSERREMKIPQLLGWITYVRDDTDIVVPGSLTRVSVEQYHKGKLLVISRDDEYCQRLSIDEKREVVLAGMKELYGLDM